ncbi:MAG: 2-phospho-L-lactate guanylyltransferase, partial [Dehalococcoidia bacterium]
APSNDGGTNALLTMPPGVIPSRFGPDSLALHIQEAEARGVPYRVLHLPSLAVDIDSPEDLAAFMDAPSSTLTLALAEEMGLRERLAQRRPSPSG